MANVRKDIVFETDAGSVKSLTESINKTLDEIKNLFADAFSEGKPKPEGLPYHHVALFLEIWKQLSRVGKFSDLQTLDNHYLQVEKNLEKTIHFYCYAANFNKDKISLATRNMFVHIIRLYHTFAKQLYQLSLFETGSSREYAEKIESVNNALVSLQNNFTAFNNAEIENKLNSFELALRELVEKLNSLNYAQVEIGFNNDLKTKYPNHNVLAKIREQLNRLPTVQTLNETITHFHEAEQSSRRRIYQVKLNEYIKLLQDIKTELTNIISQNLVECKNTLQKLSEGWAAASESLSDIEKGDHVLLSEDFRTALRMYGYKSKSGEVIKGYEEIKEVCTKTMAACKQQPGFSFSFKSNVWTLTEEKLHTLVSAESNKIEKFVFPYLKKADELTTVEKGIKESRYKTRELDTLLAYTDSLITKAKKIPEQCCSVIADVQNKLAEHIDIHSSFLKVFFTHHWLKMLLGSVGGSGVATAVGLLTVGLSPATLLVLIPAGALFGFGIGGSAGLASDQLHEKNKSAHDSHPTEKSARNNGTEEASATHQSWGGKAIRDIC